MAPFALGPSRSISASELDAVTSPSSGRMQLHVGVLQYTPSCEPFPLLADPVHYEPNTLDMNADVAFPFGQYRCVPYTQEAGIRALVGP